MAATLLAVDWLAAGWLLPPPPPNLVASAAATHATPQVDLLREPHKHFPLPEAYAYGIDTYNDIRYTAPWLLPPDQQAKLPYLGMENNLTALLKVQASHDWVTVVLYTSGHADMTLNCIYSYIHFGKAHNLVVYTFDNVSLASCRDFKLPCYNATSLLPGR